MNRNFAFRLCGELANTSANLYYGVSTGNLALTCINAGIELINLGSSIVTWNAERKRTKILQQSLNASIQQYERLKEIEKERVLASIQKEREEMQNRLELLRIELQKNRSDLMNELEIATTQLHQDIDIHFTNDEIIKTIRLKVKETARIILQKITIFLRKFFI